jgi:hypothetical protein
MNGTWVLDMAAGSIAAGEIEGLVRACATTSYTSYMFVGGYRLIGGMIKPEMDICWESAS